MAAAPDGRALIAAGVVRATPEGCELRVRAQPGASRDALAGLLDGALRVRVSAPPVEGAANDRLLRYLSREVLHLPRGALTLRTGERGRHKVLAIAAPAEQVADTLAVALQVSG